MKALILWENINSIGDINIFISKQRKEKCDSLRFEDDKKRCVLAEVLLKKGLKAIGINVDEINYEYNLYGKPYLKDYPNIYFNISHSNEYVAVVLANQEIGIDIQYVKDVNINIANKIFTINEQRQLSSSIDPKDYFFEVFSKKEAYSKYLGLGIYHPFEMIDTTKEIDYCFKQVNICDGYKCVICTKDKIDELKTL